LLLGYQLQAGHFSITLKRKHSPSFATLRRHLCRSVQEKIDDTGWFFDLEGLRAWKYRCRSNSSIDLPGILPYSFKQEVHTMPTAISTARLEARISTELHATLKRAAEIQGLTMTDFIVSAVQDAARQAIERAGFAVDVVPAACDGSRALALEKRSLVQ
jgi:hypothetical protein